MRTIVLTGGGTAGHVLPNLALLPYLKSEFKNIYYLGGNGIEKDLVSAAGVPFYQITTVKLRRSLTLKNFAIPFKLWQGIREAKKILRKLKPDVVFSKGGFVALPVVLAAAKLKIKVVAHESDMSLGLANRLTCRKCQVLCTTFPLQNIHIPNVVQTGAIMRQEIYHGDRTQIPLPGNHKINLLIIGGSLGATAINEVVWRGLKELCERYNVLHLTGKGKVQPIYQQSNYLQLEYLASPQNAFAWADLVVTRAGSGTVTELLALKKPVLYIPLPKTQSRGDQIQNANYLQSLGVGMILLQENLNVKNLLEKLNQLWQQRTQIIQNCEQQTWVDGTAKIINYLR